MTEGYSSPTQVLQKKFQEWFEDPVPADLPVPAETDHSNYETQGRQVYNLQKLLELFNFGFGGAVSLGACVGFIIFLINYSNFGGVMNDWSDQLFVIFMAMIIGFLGGMYLGSFYILREGNNFSKDEL